MHAPPQMPLRGQRPGRQRPRTCLLREHKLDSPSWPTDLRPRNGPGFRVYRERVAGHGGRRLLPVLATPVTPGITREMFLAPNTVLASAKPPPIGWAFGSIVEYPGPISGVHLRQAAQLRRATAHPARQRLCHRRFRQVAPDSGQRARRRGTVRPLAAGLGIRPLVGFSAGRPASTTRSSPRTTRCSVFPRARTASTTTSPMT